MPKEGKQHHHIDSSVMIGVFLTRDEKDREACIYYCDLIGRKYAGSSSIESLGEVAKKFGTVLTDKKAREEAFVFLGDFIFKQRLNICFTDEEDLDLAKELKGLNYTCDMAELISLAVAIRDHAEVFMILDRGMLGNSTFISEVKSRYKIAIKKPQLI